MFKYKSPLSRLLEGAGKAKEDEASETTSAAASEDPIEEKQEQPIADFNALRAALAGGNMSSDSYEETDELMPEEKMPDFAEEDTAEVEEPVEQSIFVEDEAETADMGAEEETPAPVADEQIVTLRLTTEDAVEPIEETPSEPEAIAEEPVQTPVEEPVAEEPVAEVVETPAPVAEAAPEVTQEVEAAPQPAPAQDRRSRVKTTFLGFERADTHVQDLMETAEPVAKTEAVQETFPVGWLVVTSGPGRGASITLTEGLMQIGRNDDQAIQLDFGDTGISRSNHAVIAYDPEDRKCYLGHGGKANLVRLNGKPVLSTVALSSGDLIRISETSIRFTAFCDDGFDWRDS